jgi:carbonic anhydrase
MCFDCELPSEGQSRRNFMLAGVGVALASTLPTAAIAQEGDVPPDEAMARLAEGNERYVSGNRLEADFSVGRAQRALTQRPFAAILSCADSRVSPELAYDQGPGDLFVVRVAGNFVSDDGLASLEFAVKFLGARLIVVLGHSNCGAVDAALQVVGEGAELPGHLPGMLREIEPVAKQVLAKGGDNMLDEAIAGNVRRGVETLTNADPIIAAAVAAGEVKVVGAVYDLATGRITEV